MVFPPLPTNTDLTEIFLLFILWSNLLCFFPLLHQSAYKGNEVDIDKFIDESIKEAVNCEYDKTCFRLFCCCRFYAVNSTK